MHKENICEKVLRKNVFIKRGNPHFYIQDFKLNFTFSYFLRHITYLYEKVIKKYMAGILY